MPTHYEVLGVDPGADTETIRRAYLVVAKATHPDRRQTGDPARAARAETHIRLANAAWSTLRDPERRAAYDATLRRGPEPSAARPAPSSGAAGRVAPEDPRPRPPSGIVVPQAQASLWRYTPIVVVVVVLLGLLVFSAYATSKDSGPGTGTPRTTIPAVGECVLVGIINGARTPAPVACGTERSYRISAVVDSPRPCPSGTADQVTLADQKTTLCLVVAG